MHMGTATAAASQLGISQSAVSRSVASLENKQGVILFERLAGRLVPTKEALILDKRLGSVFSSLDQLRKPISAGVEEVRVLAPPTYANGFIVNVFSAFQSANPSVICKLEVVTSSKLHTLIAEKHFDVGITSNEKTDDRNRTIPLAITKPVCIASKKHPFATKTKVTIDDINEQRLISLSDFHPRKKRLDALLNAGHSAPQVVAEVSSTYTAARLVESDAGIAILNPFGLFAHFSEKVAFLPIEMDVEHRISCVISKQSPPSKVLRNFIKHLQLKAKQDPFASKA